MSEFTRRPDQDPQPEQETRTQEPALETPNEAAQEATQQSTDATAQQPVAAGDPHPTVRIPVSQRPTFHAGEAYAWPQQPAQHQPAQHQAPQHHEAPQSYAPQQHYGQGAQQPYAQQGWAHTEQAAEAAATPRRTKQRRQWPAVAAAAGLAAVLASGGTALATGAFSDSASSGVFSNLGSTQQVAAAQSDSVQWQALASQVRDSVVAIQVVTASGQGAGSGVVIDAEHGYIVTNDHVVGDASTGGISVLLADGEIIEATIVGTDPTTDLAVIQLSSVPGDLAEAAWGDSSSVLVGEDVMAVGNPLGLASTVTTGIVSAVDRPVSTTGETSTTAVVTNAIQIDAAINPGNSGGPLFNTAGEVIGINSSIASTSQDSGSIGLGFAIPSNQASDVAAQLIEDGEAEHAFLGVTLSDGTATADGVTRAGAVVQSVSNDTPAQAAGLRAGDVIVGINAKPVEGAESLTGYIRQFASGDEVTLTVVRDGAAIDVTASLVTIPADDVATEGDTESQDGSSGQVPEQGQLPEGLEDLEGLEGFGGLPFGGMGGNG